MPESTKPQDAQAALADVGRPPAGDGPGGGHRPDARDGPGDDDGRGGRARVPARCGGAAARRTGPASGRAGLAGFVSGTSAEVGAGRAAGSREVGQRSGVASLCPRARQRGGPVHTQRRRPGTRNPTGCGGPEVASAWLRGRPQAGCRRSASPRAPRRRTAPPASSPTTTCCSGPASSAGPSSGSFPTTIHPAARRAPSWRGGCSSSGRVSRFDGSTLRSWSRRRRTGGTWPTGSIRRRTRPREGGDGSARVGTCRLPSFAGAGRCHPP